MLISNRNLRFSTSNQTVQDIICKRVLPKAKDLNEDARHYIMTTIVIIESICAPVCMPVQMLIKVYIMRSIMNVKTIRDVDTDAMITILNYWRKGNSSGELKQDAFDVLRKWVGPKKFMKVFNQINGLSKACKNKSLADDYILAAIDRMYAMLDYLCHCDDPELEYAGRYARQQALLSRGIVLDA